MDIESINASSLMTIAVIVFGIIFTFTYFTRNKIEKVPIHSDTSNKTFVSTTKGEKKTKKKERKPKKAAKKQDLSNNIKSDISAYEENDEDDDREDKNAPPPLEPVTIKIVDSGIAQIQQLSPLAALPLSIAVQSSKKDSSVEDVLRKKKAKETPEQKAARLERQKLSKVAISEVSSTALPTLSLQVASSTSGVSATSTISYEPFSSSNQQVDGWAKVEDKRKAKSASAFATPSTSKVEETNVFEAVPVVDVKKSVINVDARKVGAIIGKNGDTSKKLTELLKVEIMTPKEKVGESSLNATATISVSGPPENVPIAIRAIKDLCNKGYCTLLEGSDFMEEEISIPGMYVAEIIGKGGVVRKTLQEHSSVRIVVPANVAKEQSVIILLAGSPSKISEAKKLINELMQYYHTSVTHPGFVHNEMNVPSPLYNLIIGKGGSEIRHIQNNFKVSVYIPNADSVTQNVLVVGESRNVTQASNHIQRIIDKAKEDKEAAMIAADSWAEHETEREDDVEEEWMKAYVKKPNQNQSTDSEYSTSGEVPIMNGDENPSLSAAYKGHPASNSSRSFTPANVGQSWAATVLQSADGW